MRPARALRVLAVLLLWGCDRLGTVRGVDAERMLEVPRYDPYEAGPEFPDGRVLQHPPGGTVPRDRVVGRPELTRGVGPDGEPVAEIPVPVTAELLETGRRSFAIYCAACHGAGGYGGSMVAMNMQPPLPPSLVTGHGAQHSPGYYFDIITNGQDRMPPYAAELSGVERWAVVAYLTRVLQQPRPLGPRERADSARREVLVRRYPDEAQREHRHGHGEEAGSAQGHEHDHEHEHS